MGSARMTDCFWHFIKVRRTARTGWKADIASKPADCHTAVMRMRIGWPTQALLAAVTLTACSGTKDDPHANLMSEVEQRIVLPTGALPLAKYSRYYAQDHNGQIEGIFVVDDPVWTELVRKECATQKKAVFPCDGTGQALTAPAGTSMWASGLTIHGSTRSREKTHDQANLQPCLKLVSLLSAPASNFFSNH